MSKRSSAVSTKGSRKKTRIALSTFQAITAAGPLNTFAGDLRAALPDPQPITRALEAAFTFQANDVQVSDKIPSMDHQPTLQFSTRVSKGSNRSGKGQNQMMHDWNTESAPGFLNALLLSETPANESQLCAHCRIQCTAPVRCSDCLGVVQLCVPCIRATHSHLPTHRFKQWNGHFFQRITGAELGLVLHLGHHGQQCDMGRQQDFVLGDVNGMHQIRIRFCKHPGHRSSVRQLMQFGIYPCSEQQPATGFTFACMRQFYLMSVECKLAAHQYWTVLVHMTNPLSPRSVPDRYREFMRAARQWQHLQDLKRSGSFSRKNSTSSAPDLVVRCPVCPRLGVNYIASDVEATNRHLFTLHVSFDGSFKLYRKDKAVDSWDTCLSEGRKYFVESTAFDAFFQHCQAHKGGKTTKDADCNNHKAADNNWVRFGGLAETGLGAAICARHSFFLPLGTVNFTTGEQYLYADYSFVSVLLQSLEEGIEDVGIHYDIVCHYIVNMWTRWAEMHHPLRPLTKDMFHAFLCSIPKFHLAGHTLACFARYSLNHLFGVGRLDAEGGERCWANLNHAAASCSDSGPGTRKDLINQIMGRSNWVKTVDMPFAIAEKYEEAGQFIKQLKIDHQEFSRTFTEATLSRWGAMSITPEEKDGVWTSVFVMPEAEATSLSNKIKEMLSKEVEIPAAGGSLYPAGVTQWLQNGINLQMSQLRLQLDVTAFGSKPTKAQTKSLTHRRAQLLKDITGHMEMASSYVDINARQRTVTPSPSTDGQPESLILLLPSSFQAAPPSAEQVPSSAVLAEIEIRRILCLQHLQHVRSITMQHVHVQNTQKKRGRGIKQHNKCDAVQTRLRQRLSRMQSLYNLHQNCLHALGMTADDVLAFRPLTSQDIKSLYVDVGKSRPLGDGRVQMPWYWRVTLPELANVTRSGTEFAEEYDASLRVEWFKSRERVKRWEEESDWCQREAGSYLLHCQHESSAWLRKADHASGIGQIEYCQRQAAVFQRLEQQAYAILREVFQNTTGIGGKFCQRITAMYVD